MSYNPYREHDASKGSLSARILGGANAIGGAGMMLNGAMRGNPLLFGLGALQHHMGARTLSAGRKRQPPQQPQYAPSQGQYHKPKK